MIKGRHEDAVWYGKMCKVIVKKGAKLNGQSHIQERCKVRGEKSHLKMVRSQRYKVTFKNGGKSDVQSQR